MVTKPPKHALRPHLRCRVTLASMLGFGTLCVTVRVWAAPPMEPSVDAPSTRPPSSELVAMLQPVEVEKDKDPVEDSRPPSAGPSTGARKEQAATPKKGTAQAATKTTGSTAAPREGREVSGGSRGRKRVSLADEFLVEGRLEKPSAYYILRRSNADYDWARMDAKFLPLVLESVQDPLF